MRNSLVFSLVALATALPASAQTALRLRWELRANADPEGPHRAIFTLTNRDAKALPPSGWAIYFTAGTQTGTAKGDFKIEALGGDLQRLVPTAEFQGLQPGRSFQIEYATEISGSVVTNAPVGPYIVFDAAPEKGVAIQDYATLPFKTPKEWPRSNEDAGYQDISAAKLPLVFPTAVKEEKRAGRLVLKAMPKIHATPGLEHEAALAAEYLRPHAPKKSGGPTVDLELGAVEGQDSKEAYELEIDTRSIRLRGASPAGVFYGLQTLRGLLPVKPGPGGSELPAVKVVDAPRFGYRGMHVDVARNFQPAKSIRKVLGLMARYKLNVLHFHLTDDEGWRLEIPSLPELTQVGSRRGHTLDSKNFLQPSYGSGPEVDRPFGSGHYSKAEYIELLRYAAARHIEVIPELEMPGHARAAVKAMEARFRNLAGQPEEAKRYLLSDPQDASTYSSAQAYRDNVMNPALPSTYAFIERVVEEVVAMHREAGVPLLNLHMGGDEVPAGVWEKSPVALSLMKAQGLGSTDDFWFLFYGRVEGILKAHGLTVSGWEEIGVRKVRMDGHDKNIPNPGFANRGWRAYVWNNVPGGGNEDLAYSLANSGYKVVFCPVSNLYFDMAYREDPNEPGLSWGGYVDLDKPFNFIPYDFYRNTKLDARGKPLDPKVFDGKERLTETGRSNILGIEACLWSETLNTPGRLDYMLMPKLFGLAERAWAPAPDWAAEADAQKAAVLNQAAWNRFVNVLGKRELPRLDREMPDLEYRIPTPTLSKQGLVVVANLQMPGFTLRYTTNGSEPTVKSPTLRGPLHQLGTIKVAAFDSRGRRGRSAEIFVAD